MSTPTISGENAPVSTTGCCPPFDPGQWDDRQIYWHDKPFLKDHVVCLFHVPLDLRRHIARDMARIEEAGAQVDHQPLMLSDDQSPWGEDIFLEVKRAVPGATMDQLSGTFLTKVFEGPFRDAGKWARQLQAHVAARGRQLEKIYFGYTTCPKCAKAYGKNYVIGFARVKEPAS